MQRERDPRLDGPRPSHSSVVEDGHSTSMTEVVRGRITGEAGSADAAPIVHAVVTLSIPRDANRGVAARMLTAGSRSPA
jgi:hypothetical protein